MKRTLAFFFLIAVPAFAACSAGGATGAPLGATPQAATPYRVTLPPAWTATPSKTLVPAMPSATLTPHPAALAARQTAALWPTLHVIAVGAGADSSAWHRIEFETGSVLLPATYGEIEPRRFGDDVEGSMLALGAALAGMMPATPMPGPGTATSPPPSLEGLTAAHSLDFMGASDREAQVDVWLVSAPVPDGVDLETLMTQAAGLLQGEVEITSREMVGGSPLTMGRTQVQLFDRPRGTVEDRVLYVIVGGGRAWILTFRMPASEAILALLPVFETSALSLEPSP